MGNEVRLTARRRELLDALRKHGDQWVTSATLAFDTGKNQLSPNDKQSLVMMAEAGLIEMRKQESAIPSGYRLEYRAKQ